MSAGRIIVTSRDSATMELGSENKVSKSYHLCLDIRGVLHNWTDREFAGVFRTDDGSPMTPREAKEARWCTDERRSAL